MLDGMFLENALHVPSRCMQSHKFLTMNIEKQMLVACVRKIGNAANADASLLPWIADVAMRFRHNYVTEYEGSRGFCMILLHTAELLRRAHAKRRLVRGSVKGRIMACIFLAHSMQDDCCLECHENQYKKHLPINEQNEFPTTVTTMFMSALGMNAHVNFV